MSELFYICRGATGNWTYLSKNYGWCKHFSDARTFPSREAANKLLNGRPGSIWSESELKDSPYYQDSMSHNTLTKIESKSAVTVTATWDGVRHWQHAAKMFEQGKLFSQVMIGFELLALHKANGISQGKRSDLSHVGTSEDWDSILEEEAGLSRSTAYRYMDMAKAAAPRLKKLPALKNFDPFATSLAKLGEPQRAALTSAVKKLTDGKSQADFFNELYKQGGAGTGREAGCENNKKKLTLAEELALRKQCAGLDWNALALGFAAYKDKFLLLTDHEVEAQIAILDLQLTARKAWLKQPANNRQPAVISDLFAAK